MDFEKPSASRYVEFQRPLEEHERKCEARWIKSYQHIATLPHGLSTPFTTDILKEGKRYEFQKQLGIIMRFIIAASVQEWLDVVSTEIEAIADFAMCSPLWVTNEIFAQAKGFSMPIFVFVKMLDAFRRRKIIVPRALLTHIFYHVESRKHTNAELADRVYGRLDYGGNNLGSLNSFACLRQFQKNDVPVAFSIGVNHSVFVFPNGEIRFTGSESNVTGDKNNKNIVNDVEVLQGGILEGCQLIEVIAGEDYTIYISDRLHVYGVGCVPFRTTTGSVNREWIELSKLTQDVERLSIVNTFLSYHHERRRGNATPIVVAVGVNSASVRIDYNGQLKQVEGGYAVQDLVPCMICGIFFTLNNVEWIAVTNQTDVYVVLAHQAGHALYKGHFDQFDDISPIWEGNHISQQVNQFRLILKLEPVVGAENIDRASVDSNGKNVVVTFKHTKRVESRITATLPHVLFCFSPIEIQENDHRLTTIKDILAKFQCTVDNYVNPSDDKFGVMIQATEKLQFRYGMLPIKLPSCNMFYDLKDKQNVLDQTMRYLIDLDERFEEMRDVMQQHLECGIVSIGFDSAAEMAENMRFLSLLDKMAYNLGLVVELKSMWLNRLSFRLAIRIETLIRDTAEHLLCIATQDNIKKIVDLLIDMKEDEVIVYTLGRNPHILLNWQLDIPDELLYKICEVAQLHLAPAHFVCDSYNYVTLGRAVSGYDTIASLAVSALHRFLMEGSQPQSQQQKAMFMKLLLATYNIERQRMILKAIKSEEERLRDLWRGMIIIRRCIDRDEQRFLENVRNCGLISWRAKERLRELLRAVIIMIRRSDIDKESFQEYMMDVLISRRAKEKLRELWREMIIIRRCSDLDEKMFLENVKSCALKSVISRRAEERLIELWRAMIIIRRRGDIDEERFLEFARNDDLISNRAEERLSELWRAIISMPIRCDIDVDSFLKYVMEDHHISSSANAMLRTLWRQMTMIHKRCDTDEERFLQNVRNDDLISSRAKERLRELLSTIIMIRSDIDEESFQEYLMDEDFISRRAEERLIELWRVMISIRWRGHIDEERFPEKVRSYALKSVISRRAEERWSELWRATISIHWRGHIDEERFLEDVRNDDRISSRADERWRKLWRATSSMSIHCDIDEDSFLKYVIEDDHYRSSRAKKRLRKLMRAMIFKNIRGCTAEKCFLEVARNDYLISRSEEERLIELWRAMILMRIDEESFLEYVMDDDLKNRIRFMERSL